MKGLWLSLALGVLATSCGVNPDRMAVIEQRKLQLAQKKDSKGDIKLEYSDSDPQPIRDAVAAVNDSEAKLAENDFDGFMTRRYEALAAIGPLAPAEVLEHPKVPTIFAKMAQLDQRLAQMGSARSEEIVGSAQRTPTASADAMYALQDGLDNCARAYASVDRAQTTELYQRYEASLVRASSIDSGAFYYVGRKPSGAGLIDVPAEIAHCEARMAYKRNIWADEPEPAVDLSKEFNGCGYFAVAIEAGQTSPNVFSEYKIVGSTAQPAYGEPIACERIPPVADAPTNVQRPLRDGLMWLASGDIISMAGPFEYEQRETLYKKGVVRIFRTDVPLRTSKCGSEDTNLKCEADGSDAARAYNHTRHYLDRADHHRQNRNAAKCREMASLAQQSASANVSVAAEQKILNATNEIIPQAQFLARMEAMKSEANQILTSDWCEKP